MRDQKALRTEQLAANDCADLSRAPCHNTPSCERQRHCIKKCEKRAGERGGDVWELFCNKLPAHFPTSVLQMPFTITCSTLLNRSELVQQGLISCVAQILPRQSTQGTHGAWPRHGALKDQLTSRLQRGRLEICCLCPANVRTFHFPKLVE